MKRKSLFVVVLLFMLSMVSMPDVMAKANKQRVVFYVHLHCQGCIDKIYKTIAYEKGVKDLQCDLEKGTVVVTYDANKTDVPTLQKAFAAIGKPATTTPQTEGKNAEQEQHSHHAN